MKAINAATAYSYLRSTFAFIALATLYPGTALADDIPPEVVLAGKRATAYVETKDSSGSAFCIESSGIFVTNQHVVGKNRSVQLVINPSEKDQKVLTAIVAIADEDMDLAMLVTEQPGHFSALPLAPNNAGLIETSTLIVFGFPLGRDLAISDKSYPSVTVSIGRVTALRKAEGELAGIQLDASVTHGNSGGPVLDSKGKVIGIIEAGINGAGLNFAIPVEYLQRLLDQPQVLLLSDEIPVNRQYDENKLEFSVDTITQRKRDFRPEFILNPDSDHSRSLPMTPSGDGIYTVTVPAHKGPAPTFKIRVKLAGKVISEFDGVMPIKGAAVASTTTPKTNTSARPSSSGAPAAGPLITNGPLSFKQPYVIEVPGMEGYNGLKVHDIDGDGHQDIIVLAGNDLVILYGHGDGVTYDTKRYALEKKYYTIVIADVNKDGKPDIVLSGSGGVCVLLNIGARKFRAPTFYPTGNGASGIAIADFNGDGWPDLAVNNQDSASCSILLNRGDGTFNEARSFGVGQYPNGIAAGNFDGDGTIDLAIGNHYQGKISIYRGDGHGGFERRRSDVDVGGGVVVAGRFAGKNTLGLVGANYWGASIAMAMFDGSGGLRQTDHKHAPGFPSQVSLGDIRGDGKVDIIYGSQGTDSFTLCLGNGDGTFQDGLVFHVPDNDVHGAVIGDMNEDGAADIVADGGRNHLFIFLNAHSGKSKK